MGAAMTIEIDLPLPPRECHPNARPHFMARARAVKRYRNLAGTVGYCSRPPAPLEGPTITARWRFGTAHRRDPDNLLASLKAGIDGLVDAGVLANDHAVAYAPCEQRKVKPGEQPGVLLEISAAGEV